MKHRFSIYFPVFVVGVLLALSQRVEGIVYTETFDADLGNWDQESGTGTTTWDNVGQRMKISAVGFQGSTAHDETDTFTIANPGDQVSFQIDYQFTGDPVSVGFSLQDPGATDGAGFSITQTGTVNEGPGGSGSWVYSGGPPLASTVYTARVVIDYDGVSLNRTYHFGGDMYVGNSEAFTGPETYHGQVTAATFTSMDVYFDDVTIMQVPEPGSALLVVASAGLLGISRRRRGRARRSYIPMIS